MLTICQIWKEKSLSLLNSKFNKKDFWYEWKCTRNLLFVSVLESAILSIRIQILHFFRSMRIRIRIRIQGDFDNQKCDIRFFLEAVQLSMLGEKPSALKKNIQQTSTSKHKMSSLISIFGGNYCSILDSDPDPDDQNQSGSMLLPWLLIIRTP